MSAAPHAPGDLRRLVAADVPRLAEIERELFGPSAWSVGMLREELAADGRWYVGVDVAGPDGAPVLAAYAGLWFDGDVAQVMTLGVVPAAQRRGLGAALLAALVGRARELGAQAVLLEVRVDNEPALALYRAAGFEVLGRRRRYYQPEDVDAFTMRLELAPAPAPGSGPVAGDAAGDAYPGHHV
ncbi:MULTISPECIES: ribosomal protein S18-alanine N-acetyltransferase [unclassified Actinotalea]|uniref:ribosomal protein S18-alanine N-acetyltransferase n=1 Tax=unclassified Actinotalea TaxID=2638618 RepID=UPI001C7158B6|nr:MULTISPECIES: ribosomal protein S18-alanine N-acetyltransferase [unclassified Actinotalea]